MLSLNWTLGLLALGAAVFVYATVRARRPREIGTVRLIPYGAIQFLALLVVILMLAHLYTLVTGVPLEGRFSR